MGWPIDWVSSSGNDFNRDNGVGVADEELTSFLEGVIPLVVEQNARMCGIDAAGYVAEGSGLSVYARSDGTVYRTYVTNTPEPAMAYHGPLDLTPKGRDESTTEFLWIRRHDEYDHES